MGPRAARSTRGSRMKSAVEHRLGPLVEVLIERVSLEHRSSPGSAQMIGPDARPDRAPEQGRPASHRSIPCRSSDRSTRSPAEVDRVAGRPACCRWRTGNRGGAPRSISLRLQERAGSAATWAHRKCSSSSRMAASLTPRSLCRWLQGRRAVDWCERCRAGGATADEHPSHYRLDPCSAIAWISGLVLTSSAFLDHRRDEADRQRAWRSRDGGEPPRLREAPIRAIGQWSRDRCRTTLGVFIGIEQRTDRSLESEFSASSPRWV